MAKRQKSNRLAVLPGRLIRALARGIATASFLIATSVAALAEDTIKIGFVAERSGTLQFLGEPSYNGAQLAIKELNDAGGVTVDGTQYMFELVVADSRSEQRQASEAAVELIQDEGVDFIFGALASLAPVVLQISEPSKVLYFTGASSAAAQIEETTYQIQTLPSPQMRTDITFKGMKQIYPDVKTVAFLLPNDATTTQVLPSLEISAEKVGIEIVATEIVPDKATDVSAALTRVRSANPDALFIGWSFDHIAPVLRTNREVDAAPVYMSQSLGCKLVQDGGVDRPFASNMLVGANLDEPSTDAAAALAGRYKAFVEGDAPANMYAVMWNYDFYFMLAKAIEEAGSVDDTDAVLAALKTITYDGVVGEIKLDEFNRSVYGMDFCTTGAPGTENQRLHIEP